MGNKKTCSICTAPAEVQDAVNAALSKNTKLRDLAAQSRFSKSALHRHSQRCLARQVLTQHRTAKFNERRDLIFVEFPGQPPILQTPERPLGFEGVMRITPAPNDLIIKVTFEQPATPRVETVAEALNETEATA